LNARSAVPLGKIELLVLDVDGVLTDGRLYFSARGESLKVFHVRDGHGVKLLMQSGVAVAAVSGRRSAAVAARMRELKVPHVVQGCGDKIQALRSLTSRLGIDPLACACMVDETADLPLMAAVGFAAAVADAHPLVLAAAHWVSAAAGGQGAVRELCDALLRARARIGGGGRARARARSH
jgi:3-deoxy-D-manno-octulosonate 8-phosphate phosphatase (KDO 8-P phosphatase)